MTVRIVFHVKRYDSKTVCVEKMNTNFHFRLKNLMVFNNALTRVKNIKFLVTTNTDNRRLYNITNIISNNT